VTTPRQDDASSSEDDPQKNPEDALLNVTPLGMVSHDLKNHLMAMKSGLYLLKRHLDDGEIEQVRSYLKLMQHELQSGFAIVDRFSEFE
jgi:uncharacterized protein (DUF2267 family)